MYLIPKKEIWNDQKRKVEIILRSHSEGVLTAWQGIAWPVGPHDMWHGYVLGRTGRPAWHVTGCWSDAYSMTRSHVVARFQIAMHQQGDITPDKWGKTSSKIPMFEMQQVGEGERYKLYL